MNARLQLAHFWDARASLAPRHRLKIPTLRNIALTAPYFHDGAQAALKDAIREMAWLQLGRKLERDEVRSIAAFLLTLTDHDRVKAQALPAK